MNHLRTRAEQLAEHLRNQIDHGQLVEPLPNTRDWARQLEVGRNTLGTALKILERDGLVAHKGTKGFQLVARPHNVAPGSVRHIVRFVSYWPDMRGHHNAGSSLALVLAERLHLHDIELRTERWLDSHFRSLHRLRPALGTPAREMFLLGGLPQKYLQLFARSGKPCLLLGTPAPGISLPHVTCDWNAALRHATFHLARRGFRRVFFIVRKSETPHVKRYSETFLTACRDAPQGPIAGEIHQPHMSLASQVAVASRLPARLKERAGIIVAGPLSAGALMTALLRRGIRIPDQVEIVYTNSLPELLMVDPLPAHYPYPLETVVKTLSRLIVQFFETGKLARVQKTVPVEMTVAPPDR